jgi:hypothetical protein
LDKLVKFKVVYSATPEGVLIAAIVEVLEDDPPPHPTKTALSAIETK